jgi:DNA primase
MLEAVGSLRERVVAYYQTIAPVIANSFADTPLVYAAFPNGFTHPPTWHGPLAHDFKDQQTITVKLKSGTYHYRALTADVLVELAAHPKGAIEFHGWGCTPNAPDRVRFAHILLEHDAPPAELVEGRPSSSRPKRTLVDAAALIREQLHESNIKAIPILAGRSEIAICIPLDDGPTYPDVREWLHSICNEAVRRHPDVFTTEPNTHRDNRVHLHVSSNAPGRYSALPYSLRGTPDLLVCTPITWDELRTIRRFITANTIAERLKHVGDVFASQVQEIAKQRLPQD